MKLIAVRDWNKHFELAQSRKVDGPLSWVAMPTKHDGLGYCRIMARDDGPEVYAAWVAIVQVAAKCPTRGTLADENGPFTPADIALKTKFPIPLIEKSVKVLSGNQIGWLLVSEWERSGSTLPPHNSTGQDTTEQDKTDSCSEPPTAASKQPERGTKPAECASADDEDPIVMRFPVVGGGPTEWPLRASKMAEYRASFPGVNVQGEILKALQWTRDNPAKRKTPKGMPAFLGRWLTKVQDRGGTGPHAMSGQQRHTVSLTDNDL